MKVKEESKKPSLKLNIQKVKIMASGLITSWQIDEEKVETVTDFVFLGSKIAEDGDCNDKIKKQLLLRRKVMTNLDSVVKTRDITLLTHVRIVKAMVLKVESEKVGLKLNIQKMKIMASGLITSWEIDGETVETVSDFIFLG